MTYDDVVRSTAKHIRRVGELLMDFTNRLSVRAVLHDQSKWSPEEWPLFASATPKLAKLTYGSDEYAAALEELKPALRHHYARNPHHPEYYQNGMGGMSLFDLMELMADWKAAGERHEDSSFMRSIRVNKKRYGMSDDMVRLLLNTAYELGWVSWEDCASEGVAPQVPADFRL